MSQLADWLREHKDKYSSLLADELIARAEGELPNVERLVRQTVKSLPSNVSISASCTLVEDLLQRISALLDRVLSYRRQAEDFEALRISIALDYEFSESLVGVERQLALAESQGSHLASQEEGLRLAIDRLDGQGPHNEALRALLTAFAQSYATKRDLSRTAEIAIEQKSDLLLKRLQLRQSFHSQDGAALNLQQRQARLFALMADDCSRAWMLSLQVTEGMKRRFGVSGDDMRLPVPDGPFRFALWPGAGFLEEWVLWTRHVTSLVEQWGRETSETEVTVSLGGWTHRHMYGDAGPPKRQVWRYVDDLPRIVAEGKALAANLHEVTDVDAGDLVDKLGKRPLKGRQFATVVPPTAQYPRINGVAASVSVEEPLRPEVQHYRYELIVELGGRVIRVPNVPVFPARSPWVMPTEFLGTPVEALAQTNVAIAPTMQSNGPRDDQAVIYPSTWRITDVKLHLLLSTRRP